MRTFIFNLLLIDILFVNIFPVFAQWVPINWPGGDFKSFATSDTNIFASGTNGVFLSKNNGTNWEKIGTDCPDTYVVALAISSSNIFVGGGGFGIFLSTDDGRSRTNLID